MSSREPNAETPLEPLTAREQEILVFLSEGFSAPEIAEQLTLAISTVKFHIQNAYSKLGVSGKRQALTRAAELGLLEAPTAAGLAAQAGQPARAARQSGAAQALWTRQKRKPWEDSSLETILPDWRDGPDAAALTAAFEAGLAMSGDEAMAYALSDA